MNASTVAPFRLRLPLLCAALALAGSAQAQSLLELYDAARGYDATYLAARAQFDASQAQADQARAGLLPKVGLGAAANASRRDSELNSLDGTARARTSPSRPASRCTDPPTASPMSRPA